MDKLIAITPPHLLSPEIAIAACRARGMGILDLGYSDRPALLTPALDRLASCSNREAHWGDVHPRAGYLLQSHSLADVKSSHKAL